MTEATNEAPAVVEDEEAAFAQGLAEVQGGQPSPEAQPDAGKATESTEAAPAAKTEEPPKAEDPPAKTGTLIAGMTEEELKAALGKSGEVEARVNAEIRKVFGQYGELNRTIKELKDSMAAGPGAARKLTLTKLRAEFPDLADALESDLSAADTATAEAKAEAKTQGTPFDPEAYFAEKVSPALKEAEDRANRNAELRILKYAHPDYQTVLYADPKNRVYTPEFEAWNKSQTPERQKAIQESEDAIEIAGFVTEFKGWKAAQAKAAEGKKTRLEKAVTPTGSGQAAPPAQNDEDADLAAGFKQVRKVR